MGTFFSQIFALLTAPPGNLIYHLVLVFSIASALQSAFSHWRSSEFPQARRTMLGLGLLLLAQFFLFAFSGLGWQGTINLNASLPPLDRAFTLFSILWITWLWAFPEPTRLGDAGATLLSLLIGGAMALSLLTWPPQSFTTTYNHTIDDLLWQILSIGFIGLGLLILLIRRPNGFGSGLAILIIMFLGHAGHLLIPEEGNYSGIIRLAYMAAYPILLTLPQRFPAPTRVVEKKAVERKVVPASGKADKSAKAEKVEIEHRRYSTDPKTFHALLALAAESGALQVSRAITRAIAQAMLADLCFLVYLTDEKKKMMIVSGYDLIREENLEGGNMDRTTIPMLATAIQRGRPLRLPASSTSADIKGLGELLGLNNPGHVLSAPILTVEKDTLGAVLLLSPYSNRLWNSEDQSFLVNIASSLVPIIQRSQKVTKLEQQGEQVEKSLQAAQARLKELQLENENLSRKLETAASGAAQDAVESQKTAALKADYQKAREQIGQLETELKDLRSEPSRPESQVEADLKTALQDTARLQNQLAEANRRMLELEKNQHKPDEPNEQTEVLASLSQDLRQPMSSIMGYTDLLLGESVGILGALQRKFVERIKASTERIGSLIDDMIQVTTLKSGMTELKPVDVDLNQIIDNAMTYTSSQVREKKISLHLDLPRKLGAVNADHESLQQILIHLLQNAGAATPVEGDVHLKVQTTTEGGQDYVMIQVTDSGGGIPPEDIPRVFTRLYRADNVLIQGVGDTGVGLSIAKALTEAQHGRIWVESHSGVGSTFSVLLPIRKDLVGNASGKEIG